MRTSHPSLESGIHKTRATRAAIKKARDGVVANRNVARFALIHQAAQRAG